LLLKRHAEQKTDAGAFLEVDGPNPPARIFSIQNDWLELLGFCAYALLIGDIAKEFRPKTIECLRRDRSVFTDGAVVSAVESKPAI
jgi:hypothetical protein